MEREYCITPEHSTQLTGLFPLFRACRVKRPT